MNDLKEKTKAEMILNPYKKEEFERFIDKEKFYVSAITGEDLLGSVWTEFFFDEVLSAPSNILNGWLSCENAKRMNFPLENQVNEAEENTKEYFEEEGGIELRKVFSDEEIEIEFDNFEWGDHPMNGGSDIYWIDGLSKFVKRSVIINEFKKALAEPDTIWELFCSFNSDLCEYVDKRRRRKT